MLVCFLLVKNIFTKSFSRKYYTVVKTVFNNIVIFLDTTNFCSELFQVMHLFLVGRDHSDILVLDSSHVDVVDHSERFQQVEERWAAPFMHVFTHNSMENQ